MHHETAHLQGYLPSSYKITAPADVLRFCTKRGIYRIASCTGDRERRQRTARDHCVTHCVMLVGRSVFPMYCITHERPRTASANSQRPLRHALHHAGGKKCLPNVLRQVRATANGDRLHHTLSQAGGKNVFPMYCVTHGRPRTASATENPKTFIKLNRSFQMFYSLST